MIRRRATPKKRRTDAVGVAEDAEEAAAEVLDGTAEERLAAAEPAPEVDPAVILPERVGTSAFGFNSVQQHHSNEVIRQRWRGAPQLMALLSEKNVQRVRQMFDSKQEDDGLLLSEFLFVLQQALVRCVAISALLTRVTPCPSPPPRAPLCQTRFSSTSK